MKWLERLRKKAWSRGLCRGVSAEPSRVSSCGAAMKGNGRPGWIIIPSAHPLHVRGQFPSVLAVEAIVYNIPLEDVGYVLLNCPQSSISMPSML